VTAKRGEMIMFKNNEMGRIWRLKRVLALMFTLLMLLSYTGVFADYEELEGTEREFGEAYISVEPSSDGNIGEPGISDEPKEQEEGSEVSSIPYEGGDNTLPAAFDEPENSFPIRSETVATPPGHHNIIVINGSGGGDYAEGKTVTLTASYSGPNNHICCNCVGPSIIYGENNLPPGVSVGASIDFVPGYRGNVEHSPVSLMSAQEVSSISYSQSSNPFKEWLFNTNVEFIDGTDKNSHTVKFVMPAQAVAAAVYENTVPTLSVSHNIDVLYDACTR
jgi:hypothetical protein